ncbi:hypothetical protein F511_34903 [Dorcoceras hygrometricum]|uniref:Uncharacterized protein n=1 Tax=Dorcoceras hygrometricum TaxID=472368 RepID=A0A2Z7A7R3_9LAMI|nr:hypothetical protein F511_34903 [Dorcoceras hygrometricum]
MAQYQIFARKLLGLPGTGPKPNLEDKSAVAMPPRVRRTAAPRRRPPPAQGVADCRTLRADPSLGSDTTVGPAADPDPVSRDATEV